MKAELAESRELLKAAAEDNDEAEHVKELEERLLSAQEEVKRLEAELAKARDESAQNKTMLKTLQEQIASKSHGDDLLQEKEEKIEQLNQHVATLEKEAREFKEEAGQERTRLEKSNATLLATNVRLTDDLANLEDSHSRLESERDNKTMLIEDLRKQLESKHKAEEIVALPVTKKPRTSFDRATTADV